MSAEDLNAEVLQRMHEGGDDLAKARLVDFSHVFPALESATSFAKELRGRTTKVQQSGCVPELPWDVVVSIDMIPGLAAITEMEALLDQAARRHGGRTDGWGCQRVT